jgi:hypothetical protein
MTDRALVDADSLLAKYTNIQTALPDMVLLSASSNGSIHRQEGDHDEPLPMCRNSGEWVPAELEDALVVGRGLCTFCFKAVLEHHVQRDDSPVEYRDPEAKHSDGVPVVDEDVADLLDEHNITQYAPALTARPREVLYAAGSNVYHAPTEDGPHCATGGDFRQVEFSTVAGHFTPCENCFVTDELSEPETPEPATADD